MSLFSALVERARTLPFLLLALCLVAPAVDAAQRHALLVGVSEYPGLTDRSLYGPKNDIRALRALLQRRGFDAKGIRVLADQVPGAMGLPTRDAILSELKALSTRANKGDFVFLYFAGHGSQQPARDLGPANPELDGLDEVFLPRDVAPIRDQASGVIPNGITDNEFEEIITAIRRRGAFVWAVFDTCHSGTITRGVPDEGVRYRNVPPGVLGIDRAMIDKAALRARELFASAATPGAAAARVSAALGADAGGLVVFTATQENELAKEDRMPPGVVPRESMGVFTFSLIKALELNPTASYRQLGQQVHQNLSALNHHSQTPTFEGPALDAPVFGTRGGAQVRQWPFEGQDGRMQVAAGALQQIGVGAIFAALPDAVTPDDKALGYLEVERVGVFESTLRPVAYNNRPAPSATALEKATIVRLVRANLSTALRVTLPPAPAGLPKPESGRSVAGDCKAGGGAEAPEAKARAVIEALRRRKTIEGVSLEWTRPEAGGDVRLLVFDDKLWLVPASGELVCAGPLKTHSIDLRQDAKEIEDKLAESFRRIAKVVNLSRLSAQTIASSIAEKVQIELFYERGGGKPIAFSAGQVPRLRNGDKLSIRVTNEHLRPVDLTVLFIASDYAIIPIFPQPRAGESNRILPRQTLQLGGGPPNLDLTVRTQTAGREQFMFIAVEGLSQEPARFDFLTQASLGRTRGGDEARRDAAETNRGADAGTREVIDALIGLGAGSHATRSVGVSTPIIGRTLLRMVPIEVVP